MSVNKVNSDGSTTLLAGATLWADSPIGTILAYGGATAPAGWFICQGQELTKTEYAELYAVIGDAFGTASVNTKFVLPDLREATTKGAGLTGKSNNHYDSDGVALGEFVEDRVQRHIHDLFIGDTRVNGSGVTGNDNKIASIAHATSSDWGKIEASEITNGRSGATTEVKAVGVNYIIKARQIALPADFMSAVDEAVEEAMADTGWVTVNSYVKARRIGKIVSLALTYDNSVINAGNWTKVADLDTRFRPSKQVIGCSYCYENSTYDNYFISLAGAVNLLGNASLEATVEYFAD